MKTTSAVAQLEAEIEVQESLQAYQFQLMRQQFHLTADRLKPSKLLASTFKDVITPSETGTSIIDNTIGIATGFLTRKFLFGASANPVKKAIGTMVQFGISNLVYKNSMLIKAVGGFLFKKLLNKKKPEEIEDPSITIT